MEPQPQQHPYTLTGGMHARLCIVYLPAQVLWQPLDSLSHAAADVHEAAPLGASEDCAECLPSCSTLACRLMVTAGLHA